MLLPGRCFVGTVRSSIGFYFQFDTKILVYPAIELWLIIGYNRLRYFEPTHNILP